MLKRLNWIIISYLKCPLTLGAVGFSVFFFMYLLLPKSDQRRVEAIIPEPQRFSHSIVDAAGLHRIERRHEEAQIEQIKLDSLAADARHDSGEDPTAPGARDYSELLEKFPNLRSVDIGLFSTIQPQSQFTRVLAKLEHLEFLSLWLDRRGKPDDLAWLAMLP